MWSWLASFLGGPVINGLIGAYKAKLDAGNTHDRIAADLAQRELAVQEAENAAQAQLKVAEVGHPWEVEKLFGYVTLAYYAKLLVWDKMLGLGSTDPLAGWAATTANLVVGFYFTKRTIENAVRIWKR